MNIDFLFEVVLPVLGVALTFCVFFWFIKQDVKAEEKRQKDIMKKISHFEAQILSKKLKESRVELAVKKPQSFKTKRKLQKKLDN